MMASPRREQMERLDNGSIETCDVNIAGNRSSGRLQRIIDPQANPWKDKDWTEQILQGPIKQNKEGLDNTCQMGEDITPEREDTIGIGKVHD